MPSDDQNPRNPSTPQPIPLQDLSRPPDNRDGDEEWGGVRRESAGRARALMGNRQAFSGRIKTFGRYERVLAGSSTEASSSSLDVPHVTTPRNAHQPSGLYDDGELSPLNIGEFQAAMGSVGLALDTPGSDHPPISSASEGAHLGPIMEDTATSPFSSFSAPNDGEYYFANPSDDRSPLTDNRFLQPISGSPLPAASGQRHDREHRPSLSYSRGMLGDDLPNVENGTTMGNRRSLNRTSSLSIPSLSRSLSTSASPLSTAGTMIRKMSQRVVNLSNDPEDVDQPPAPPPPPPRLHRQATLDAPPAFPAMTEYAHDEPSRSPSPLEKAPPLRANGSTREKWQKPVNPLKGKSLGVFGPEHPLRLWLCEVLVHPITEPIILVLIIIQTILLAADAGESKPFGARTTGWRSAWVEYGLLALFIVYTMEISAHIIVSGFLRNAHDYRTSRSGLTFKNVMLEKLQELIAPLRHTPGTKVITEPSPNAHVQSQFSIVRTFTAIQGLPEQRGHSRQAQRVRLARRAFLRHSFNRLDFVAVVSYWISLVLTLTGVATNKHFYTFQMLSCLRMVRLLGLTSGTSVCSSATNVPSPIADSIPGHSSKPQKGSTAAPARGILDRIFLAPICHCRGAAFQILVSPYLRVFRRERDKRVQRRCYP